MERILKRELCLSENEVEQAILEFLEARDIPVGDTRRFEFTPGFDGCIITSTEEAQIELAEQHGVR